MPPILVPVTYELRHPETSECPRSCITQASEDLVQSISGYMSVHEGSGASLAVSEMPGAVFDAMRLASRENKAVDAAQDEAVSRV